MIAGMEYQKSLALIDLILIIPCCLLFIFYLLYIVNPFPNSRLRNNPTRLYSRWSWVMKHFFRNESGFLFNLCISVNSYWNNNSCYNIIILLKRNDLFSKLFPNEDIIKTTLKTVKWASIALSPHIESDQEVITRLNRLLSDNGGLWYTMKWRGYRFRAHP